MASTIFGGPSYISKILNLLEDNDLNYYASEQSLIYPALSMFIFYSDKEVYKKLCQTMIKIFKKQFDKLINSIEIIGYLCFKVDTTENIIHDILFKIFEKNKEYDIDKLLDISADFILYRYIKLDNENNLNDKISVITNNLKNRIQRRIG